MAIGKKSFLIEIPEDAYKQNAVYRPWDDIRRSGPATYLRTTLSQPQPTRMPVIAEPTSREREEREE